MKTLKTTQIASSNYHYIKYSLPYFLDSMARLDQHLIEFLLSWLINHILYTDKKIPLVENSMTID